MKSGETLKAAVCNVGSICISVKEKYLQQICILFATVAISSHTAKAMKVFYAIKQAVIKDTANSFMIVLSWMLDGCCLH